MSVKLLTEHHLEFLSLKGGCTCSSESTFVKMQHCNVGNHMSWLIYEKNRLEVNRGRLRPIIRVRAQPDSCTCTLKDRVHTQTTMGEQWLSCRVLDLRPRGRGFEPHRRHCVVVKTRTRHIYPSLVLIQPRKAHPCFTERLLMGRKESNQANTNSKYPNLKYKCTSFILKDGR